MGAREIEWVVKKIVKAIIDGRPNQAYGLTVALAHYVK
jgi:hypothetical protein